MPTKLSQIVLGFGEKSVNNSVCWMKIQRTGSKNTVGSSDNERTIRKKGNIMKKLIAFYSLSKISKFAAPS